MSPEWLAAQRRRELRLYTTIFLALILCMAAILWQQNVANSQRQETDQKVLEVLAGLRDIAEKSDRNARLVIDSEKQGAKERRRILEREECQDKVAHQMRRQQIRNSRILGRVARQLDER